MAAISVSESELNEQYLRGPSMNASYQVPIHVGNRYYRRRLLRNQPIRKKKLYVAAMFVNGSELN